MSLEPRLTLRVVSIVSQCLVPSRLYNRDSNSTVKVAQHAQCHSDCPVSIKFLCLFHCYGGSVELKLPFYCRVTAVLMNATLH